MTKLTAAFLIMLPFFAFKCEKNCQDKCLKVKIVRITCATIVMQSLNDESVGEDGWKDINNRDSVYNNVFNVSNKCEIASEYQVGDVVYVTTLPKQYSPCIICAQYDAPPGASLQIETIDRLPCSDDDK